VVYCTLEQIQCDMPEHREIFGGVPLANTAVVFAKGDVEHPVQGVLDGPVPPDTLGNPRGVQTKATDVGWWGAMEQRTGLRAG
jgi:hypothetical protein